jgi:F0F1-type ATP synthase assembly protein I
MMPLPYRVLVVQTLVAGLIAAMLVLLVSVAYAVAALLAGITVLIPNAYFAWRVVNLDARDDPERASRRLVIQGLLKQLLMLAMMVAVFIGGAPAAWPFFGTLIALLGTHGLAAAMLGGPPRGRMANSEMADREN